MTKRYLIVDDDARSRQMIRTLLMHPDIEFSEAASGTEATALYRAERPDLVIMDLEMRPVDGLVAMREIREINRDGCVIIVSQYDSRQLREAAEAAGACAYVSKEHLSELEPLVKKVTGQKP